MTASTENPSAVPPEKEIATQVEKARKILNTVRLGSMILPVAGLAVAVTAGPVAVWVAGLATGISLLSTRLASSHKRDELQQKIEKLRLAHAISEDEADRLKAMARRIVTGSQPVTFSESGSRFRE